MILHQFQNGWVESVTCVVYFVSYCLLLSVRGQLAVSWSLTLGLGVNYFSSWNGTCSFSFYTFALALFCVPREAMLSSALVDGVPAPLSSSSLWFFECTSQANWWRIPSYWVNVEVSQVLPQCFCCAVGLSSYCFGAASSWREQVLGYKCAEDKLESTVGLAIAAFHAPTPCQLQDLLLLWKMTNDLVCTKQVFTHVSHVEGDGKFLSRNMLWASWTYRAVLVW